MYELKFTLQQHTPIIHFQHDQDGATLRATEVKPKLDRFILNELGNGNYDVGVKEAKAQGWLMGEHAAMRYKLGIEAVNLKINYLKDSLHQDGFINPLYFGNMGDDSSSKHYSVAEKVNVTISSFCKDLIDAIDQKLICNFFLFDNFGCRSNKGFGSFSISVINGNSIEMPLIPKGTYLLILQENLNTEQMFGVIDYYWKRLKSGINYSKQKDRYSGEVYCYDEQYQKSFLYQYINNYQQPAENYTWEKRWMKEKFFGLSAKANQPQSHFARALLGLQDKFEFINKDTCNPDEEELSEMSRKFQKKNIRPVHAENKDKQIERIPSPILFKPMKVGKSYHVYLFVQDKHISSGIYSGLVSKNFSFESNKSEKISLPEKNINFHDLLDKYHQHLGSSFEAKDYKWRTISKVQILKHV